MHRYCLLWLLVMPLVFASISGLEADDGAAARRRQLSQEFHVRSQERTGLLVPLYIYPSDIHKNPTFNRLIDVKRRQETVPMWVILNPASGPGEKIDGNYTKAIDRLRGAGCLVLGYVTTSYARRPEADVRKDIDQWLKMYPRIHGIFFDEMTYEDTEVASKYQTALTHYAHEAGCWPTVANPGADTPGRYFAAGAADVIVIHEGDSWPKEDWLKGDYFGGYSDYPPFTRGVLVYAQPKLDRDALRMVRKYARWIYVTEAVNRSGNIPWARLSKHLEEICDLLAER